MIALSRYPLSPSRTQKIWNLYVYRTFGFSHFVLDLPRSVSCRTPGVRPDPGALQSAVRLKIRASCPFTHNNNWLYVCPCLRAFPVLDSIAPLLLCCTILFQIQRTLRNHLVSYWKNRNPWKRETTSSSWKHYRKPSNRSPVLNLF